MGKHLDIGYFKKTLKVTAIYAVFWGFLTALARVVANYSTDFPLETLHQYGFETVVRLCHGLGPLLILFLLNKQSLKK